MSAIFAAGLIVVALAGATASVVLLAYVRFLNREHTDGIASMQSQFDRQVMWYERQVVQVRDECRRLLHNASDVAARREQSHTETITRLQEGHARGLEAVLSMREFGTPAPRDAQIADAEPDSDQRILKRISEEAIATGITAMMNEYEKRGIVVAPEEVRDEVIAMLMGNPVEPNPEHVLHSVRD